ncbi:MAG: oligosaccharide flippase family protein, partial [Candidatus Methylomirabilales bacterium]
MSGISLGRVTTLLLLGRAAGYVLALGNSVILARVLGVERLGVYAYAMGVAALFGLLPNLGISTILTRTIAQGPDAGAAVVRAAMRAQALLAGGVLIAIPAFAALLPGQPVPLGYVALAAAQLAVGTLS